MKKDNTMDKNNYYKDYIDYVQEHSKHTDDCTDLLCVHHIIPKALGGSNDKDNLVKLTYAEHIKAHELLFKTYFEYAKLAAHALVSMVGKDNLQDTEVLGLDMLKDLQTRADDARKLMTKRTVYDRITLEPIRIGMLEKTPRNAVDMIRNLDNSARIINIEEFMKTGKRRFVKWNKDQELPASNWKYVTDLTEDERLAVFPYIKELRERRGNVRWVHELSTGKNKQILKSLPLPEGYAEGILFSEKAQQRLKECGRIGAKSLQFENGGRWIHNIQTKKNKLIDRLAPLPIGYAEGTCSKKHAAELQDLQNQIEALKAQLAVQA